MLRDLASFEPTSTASWPVATPLRAVIDGMSGSDADPTRAGGELSPVWREIARRIARNAYTTHPSTLGDALRRSA